jgi:hypothetical protein
MAESTRTSEPVLTALADDFDIVGELGGAPGTRFLIATRKAGDGKRRDDAGGGRVIIEIVRSPEGDESHALDHVASDTKLLSTLRHRRLVPVLEGRWVGDDAFAVVREQVDDPSVADLLERGDPFTNVRTAALLREVHGLLQWAREHDIVHRRVTTDRVFLEPTSDRVRVSFAAGPLQRVRATDATTEDVQTVVKLAVAMLTGPQSEETEGQSFAEQRPDLPDRLHEETERLLKEPATDHDLTLYLALIGMADPVAEGETERDRIRAEVLEEQRVEREKLANERAELERHVEEERQKLIGEGEELRGAFEKEKANLQREFAAAQRLIAAERTEMQRIITDERAELAKKRDALERTVTERIAEIERAAEEDRATIEALRQRIQKAGEEELEKKRAAALEELDDAEIKLNTGRYATPRFVEPQLEPFPKLAFRQSEHTTEKKLIEAPKVDEEPALVMGMVERLKAPRKKQVEWKRWAVRGGIAAVILITAGSALLIESRSPDFGTAVRTARPAPKVNATPRAPVATPPAATAPAPGAATTSTANGSLDSTAKLDSARKAQASTAGVKVDSANGAIAVDDSVARARRLARRDSLQRAAARDSAERASARRAAERENARRDSVREAEGRASATDANPAPGRSDTAAEAARQAPPARAVQSTRRDDQDLMMLSDSLSKSPPPAPSVTPTGPPPGNTGPQ